MKNNSKNRRAVRHAKAVDRQASFAALSTSEKLAKLTARGHDDSTEAKILRWKISDEKLDAEDSVR